MKTKKYIKSILIAAVALFGLVASAGAQTTIVTMVTTDSKIVFTPNFTRGISKTSVLRANGGIVSTSGAEITIDAVDGKVVLTVTDGAQLTALSVNSNTGLTELTVIGCPELQYIFCWENALNKLSITNCAIFEELRCSYNRLPSLTVTGCPEFSMLSCDNNELTSLDASGWPKLTELYYSNNRIKMLNLTGCKSDLGVSGYGQEIFIKGAGTESTFINPISVINQAGQNVSIQVNGQLYAADAAIPTSVTGKVAFATGETDPLLGGNIITNDAVVAVIKTTKPTVSLAAEWVYGGMGKPPVGFPVSITANGVALSNDKDAPTSVAAINGLVVLESVTLADLTLLNCPDNGITELELRSCPNLAGLDCSGNALLSLDVRNTKISTVVLSPNLIANGQVITLPAVSAVDGKVSIGHPIQYNDAISSLSITPKNGGITSGVRTINWNVTGASGEVGFDFAVATGIPPKTKILFGGTVTVPWVNSTTVSDVTLDNDKLDIVLGQSAVLTETVAPSNATDKSVTWSSDKPAIATVSADGVVTAVGYGKAIITVTTTDGSKKATCEVSVYNDVPVVADKTITVEEKTHNSISLSWVAATDLVTSSTELIYVSVYQKVGASSQLGDFEVVGITSYTITGLEAETEYEIWLDVFDPETESASYNNIKVTTNAAPVTTVPVSGVTLPETLSIEAGKSVTLTAAVAPADASDKAVTWASGNESVAKVSSSGVVTAVASGTATITVTTVSGSKKAACVVTVTGSIGVTETEGDNIIAYTAPAGIVIKGAAEGTLITVYSVLGVPVATAITQDGETYIALPQSGIYVARVGNISITVVR